MVGSCRVPNSMAFIRKHHEHRTGNRSDDRRQNLQQDLLRRFELRVKAIDSIRIEKSDHGEHHEREQSMDEVSDPQPIIGQIRRRRRGRPDSGGSDDAVVADAVGAGVAVGEGGEAAIEGADGEESGGEVLVDGGGAVAGVGEDGVEELEEEDGAGREELDEISK